jgi:hypothetical protein
MTIILSDVVVNPHNTDLVRAAANKARIDSDWADVEAADTAWFRASPLREWRARRARGFEVNLCPYDYRSGVVYVVLSRAELHRRDRFNYRFQAVVNFDCDAADDRWCSQIAATAWAKLHANDCSPVLITH